LKDREENKQTNEKWVENSKRQIQRPLKVNMCKAQTGISLDTGDLAPAYRRKKKSRMKLSLRLIIGIM